MPNIGDIITQLDKALTTYGLTISSINLATKDERDQLAAILARECGTQYDRMKYEKNVVTFAGIVIDYD